MGNEINRIGLGIMEVRMSRHAHCNKVGPIGQMQKKKAAANDVKKVSLAIRAYQSMRKLILECVLIILRGSLRLFKVEFC
jgi:hypothetical protein